MSITFPFGLILIPAALAVAVLAVMAVLALYHMVHYGATFRVSIIATCIYLAGTALIFFVTMQLLEGTDWHHPLTMRPAIQTFTNDQTGL